MIKDLIDPTAHHDPYVWAAVLLAHAMIGAGATTALGLLIAPLTGAAVISIIYLIVWEGAQLQTALQRGDSRVVAMADGVLDAVGVALGCSFSACLSTGSPGTAIAAVAALLVVAAVGYQRRAR